MIYGAIARPVPRVHVAAVIISPSAIIIISPAAHFPVVISTAVNVTGVVVSSAVIIPVSVSVPVTVTRVIISPVIIPVAISSPVSVDGFPVVSLPLIAVGPVDGHVISSALRLIGSFPPVVVAPLVATPVALRQGRPGQQDGKHRSQQELTGNKVCNPVVFFHLLLFRCKKYGCID